MKILLVHNYYQIPGGEDVVFRQERDLLLSHGHEVFTYERNNADIVDHNLLGQVRLAFSTIGSMRSYQEMTSILQHKKPDIVHFHNTFPLISPLAYHTVKRQGIPVIQTLHNYRLLCLNAILYRNGSPCEACMAYPVPWPGIKRGCYHESVKASSVVASMLVLHRALRTWQKDVDQFIALTYFARNLFIRGGLPQEKITVKPNFVNIQPDLDHADGRYAVFIGRLVPGKGIHMLVKAWQNLPEIPLKIIGDGPLFDDVQKEVKRAGIKHLQILGRLPHKDIFPLLKHASFIVFPSSLYESFGLVILEAFASGKAVICANIGGIPEIVTDRYNGLLFQPGNSNDLATTARWAWNNPQEIERMGKNAETTFLQKYTPEANYQQLMKIYQSCLQ